MSDLISRQAAIDALWKALYEYEDKTEKQFIESDELDVGDWIQDSIFVQNMNDIDRQTILNLPSAQPEITDAQAIDHLRSTWWMQNHDHEMYMMGMRDGLANDSNSYDSLIQPEQKVGTWIIDGHHLRCSACGVYMCSEDREGDRIALHFCPNCGVKMAEE